MATYGNGLQMIESYSLREWSPLSEILDTIPHKTFTGIFSHHVKFTCVDVLSDFLVLGTNFGLLYWYDRKNKDFQELRCENFSSAVTKVKVISTVDYMIAAGSKNGNISIFQVPKSHPDCVPESLKPKTSKKIERYTVADLHKSEISAIEWSKNGMKLFTGDKNGCVVFTEIDFYMHICKSVEILNEAYQVIQLSYNQQRLLVSTIYRSIICQKTDKWRVCQVGKKDRKLLGSFGGIIYQNSLRPTDLILYCTRPGLRIWVSDIEGNVQKTLLFKDLLNKECDEVPLINPASKTLISLKPQKEPNFGTIILFKENLLVTYNDDIVYILDPLQMCVLYKISYLRRIIDIASYKNEIFILEEDRNLIRISDHPESQDLHINASMNSVSPVESIKKLRAKINSSNIISAIPPLFENTVSNENIKIGELEMSAEEAKESPIKSHTAFSEQKKAFDEIGKQDFSENIIFRKKKHKKNSMTSSSMSLSSTSSEEKDGFYLKPVITSLSSVGVLPDLRSPESIKNDIEYKEKILADILNLESIKVNDGYASQVNSETNAIKVNNAEEIDSKYSQEEKCEGKLSQNTQKQKVELSLDIKSPLTKKINENNIHCETVINERCILDRENHHSPLCATITPSENTNILASNKIVTKKAFSTRPSRHEESEKLLEKIEFFSIKNELPECSKTLQDINSVVNELVKNDKELSFSITDKIKTDLEESARPHKLAFESSKDCDKKTQKLSNPIDIPACLRIPNDWKLADIHLNTTNEVNAANEMSPSDNSLNDWEIV